MRIRDSGAETRGTSMKTQIFLADALSASIVSAIAVGFGAAVATANPEPPPPPPVFPAPPPELEACSALDETSPPPDLILACDVQVNECVIPVCSEDNNECVNAPIVDYPSEDEP